MSERTALAVTTTAGDVRIHDVTAPHVAITTTAGDLHLSDVAATVAISARADYIVLERVHGPKRITADSGSVEVYDFPIHAERSSPTAAASSACAASTATSASPPRWG